MASGKYPEGEDHTETAPIARRRRFLQSVGVAGAVGVAGCTGGEDNGEDNGDNGDPDDDPNGDDSGFEVSDLSPGDSEVSDDETVDVSATITNTGSEEAAQDIEFRLEGAVLGTESVTLAGDEDTSVSFSVETANRSLGEHAYGVYSEDDDETATLTVIGEDLLGSEPAVLVFSATAGWRHANIETGNERLEEMGQEIIDRHAAYRETEAEEVTIDVIDDPDGDASEFPSDVEELEEYDVIVWNSTTGELFDEDQQTAFREYIEGGGGFAGIHAASDTHYEWDWYGEDLVGAYFDGHPSDDYQIQSAEVKVTDRMHPSTEFLPVVWEREDEWYDFDRNPRGDVHVLATLDERTYELEGTDGMGADHPIAWCRPVEDGRAWYTAGGHTEESWSEDDFVEHVLNGLMWAAGWLEGDATGTIWDTYEKEVLESGISEPMAMAITPDERVFYIQRGGRVGVIDIESGESSTALELDVFFESDRIGEVEDGGLGIAFDPDFEDNSYVYIYYSPALDTIDEPYDRLSRFEVVGDVIDADSEEELLQVHKQNDTESGTGHAGGDVLFDAEGNLYLTVGDDTTPFESDNFTPIDETQHEGWDAQGTSANSATLRGKILRITPTEDGYEIPEGNFKEYWEDETGEEFDDEEIRPEIYVWGCRNPFRASVDHETGVLYYGDYGPDAGDWNDERGPIGIVEYNRSPEPGFDGWPYVIGPNIPFVDYDFETGESGEMFDPDSLVNDSPNNDGIEELPMPDPATMYTPYNWNTFLDVPDNYEEYVPEENPFPSLPGGGAPMSGANYRYHNDYGEDALSPSYDGKWIIMEWGQGWIKYVTEDEDGNVQAIDDFMPDESWFQLMDMEVGHDGTLYVMEYGDGRISVIRRN